MNSLSKERKRVLDCLVASLGISFSDYTLLNQALVHRSYARETGSRSFDNERLEFLGDSVLGLLVTQKLYEKYPAYPEGRLTRIKSFLVSESFLSMWALSYNLGSYLLFSKGEKLTGGAFKPAILADAFEALIGAYYLDQGLVATKVFLDPYLDEALAEDTFAQQIQDSKVLLQQLLHKLYKISPSYELIEESGPDHQKIFIMSVSVAGKVLAVARGRSKKEAEKEAARLAYAYLRDQKIDLKS